MLVAGVACWRLFSELATVKPVLMAGHSLGEWSALVASGAVDFSEAVKLVKHRAQLMQSAIPADESGMAAILGLEDEQVIELCQKASQDSLVEAVNFNSPGQIVVAGRKDAVERLMLAAKDAGAKRALPLAVSVPSHSSLLSDAGRQLFEAIDLKSFRKPNVPIVHNVDAKQHHTAEAIRDAVSAQIYKPVLWVDCVNAAKSEGVDTFIEVGPGKVLAGLCKRIDRSLNIGAFESVASITKTMDILSGE